MTSGAPSPTTPHTPAAPATAATSAAPADPARPSPSPGTTALLLGVSFLVGLVLILPAYGALGTRSYGALWLWGLAGLLAAVVAGGLARLLLQRGLAAALATAAGFALLFVAGIALVAATPDPPGDAVLALLVGLPAAALAALASAVVLARAADDVARGWLVAAVAALLLALTVAPQAGEALAGARSDAERAAALDASGLDAYLPELEDRTASFSSTTRRGEEVVGYSIAYRTGDRVLDSLFFVSGELVDSARTDRSDPLACEADGLYDCTESDGYYLLSAGDDLRSVVAEHGTTRLSVSWDDDIELSPEQVGRALADADEVDWLELVSRD